MEGVLDNMCGFAGFCEYREAFPGQEQHWLDLAARGHIIPPTVGWPMPVWLSWTRNTELNP